MWIALFRNKVVLLINSYGMKYEGKMMRWDTIVAFWTTTYDDSETGKWTSLGLQLSNSYLSVDINISRLGVSEDQIREWIRMYSPLPADEGHRIVEC